MPWMATAIAAECGAEQQHSRRAASSGRDSAERRPRGTRAVDVEVAVEVAGALTAAASSMVSRCMSEFLHHGARERWIWRCSGDARRAVGCFKRECGALALSSRSQR